MIHRTALIIDDEPPIMQIVKTVLSGAGYTVFTANNGTVGIEIAKKHRPGIIILDRYMPEMDGNETLKHLKNNKATSHIPVIMLTGENKLQEIKKSIELGANGYIVKPFKSGDFLKQVNRTFDKTWNQL